MSLSVGQYFEDDGHNSRWALIAISRHPVAARNRKRGFTIRKAAHD
jgi:hypothetical protein